MVSEADKCYLCDLLGDFEEFKDIKKQFDDQHECWKQNELKKETNSKTQQNDQIVKSAHNVIGQNDEHEVTDERTRVKKPKNISIQLKNVQNENLPEGKNMKVKIFQQKDKLETHKQKTPFMCDLCDNHFSSKQMMNLHAKTIHEGKRKLVRCDVCDKYFTTKQVLQPL